MSQENASVRRAADGVNEYLEMVEPWTTTNGTQGYIMHTLSNKLTVVMFLLVFVSLLGAVEPTDRGGAVRTESLIELLASKNRTGCQR